MHNDNLARWQHDHTFEQDQRRPGETRTLIVIGITATMMVVEIVAGIHYGSMALLADGLHMASHTVALGITAFAYVYARRHARNPRFSFGTGKVNALGGFTGAVLLAVFALYMCFESISRLFNPVEIAFNQAIAVAILGLLVNGASVLILDVHDHGHGHGHGHQHSHGDSARDHHLHSHGNSAHDHHQYSHGNFAHDHHQHSHGNSEHSHHHHSDHNLKSAYLHVMADALTSLLAIVALLSAKHFGWVWMDPVMGIVGGVLVARWSYGLLGSTSSVLLDCRAPEELQNTIRDAIQKDGDSRITDLHVWSIGPGIYSAQIALVAHDPVTPNEYKDRIPESVGVAHIAVEIQHCEPQATNAVSP